MNIANNFMHIAWQLRLIYSHTFRRMLQLPLFLYIQLINRLKSDGIGTHCYTLRWGDSFLRNGLHKIMINFIKYSEKLFMQKLTLVLVLYIHLEKMPKSWVLNTKSVLMSKEVFNIFKATMYTLLWGNQTTLMLLNYNFVLS